MSNIDEQCDAINDEINRLLELNNWNVTNEIIDLYNAIYELNPNYFE